MQTQAAGPGRALRGALLVLTAATLWGMIGPVAKIAMREGMSAMDIAWWRTLSAWLLFAGLALARGEPKTVRAKDLGLVLGFGVLGVAGLHGFYVLAVRESGAAVAAVLLYTAPAWVALLSRLVLKEPLTKIKLLAVGLTISGVTMVCLSGSGGGSAITSAGLFYGIASAVSYSLFYIFGKLFHGRYSTTTLFLYTLPAALAAISPGCDFTVPSAAAVAAGAWLGLMCTFGAVSIYYMGLAHLETTTASVIASVEPVVAAALAYAMFGEVMGAAGYLGAGLILLATLLSLRRANGPARVSRDQPSRRTIS